MADTAITTTEVQKAAGELARMRRSLKSWLRYRSLNDAVLAGTKVPRKPLAYAQRVVSSARDMSLEQDMADQLHTLLSTVMPNATLPNANVATNPDAAVQLATIAINGQSTTSPVATSGFFTSPASHPWLWPVLIVGGVVLLVTTSIKTSADVAKDHEQTACIEAGACTDYGFWLKAGGIVALSYFAWNALGVRELVHDFVRPRRGGSSAR